MSDLDLKPKGALWLFIILVLIGFTTAVIYFGRKNPSVANGDPVFPRPSASRPARVYTVFYGLGVFSPTNIRIHVGDSVRFQNDSKLPIVITSDTTNGVPDLPGFDSVGEIQPSGAFTYTFSNSGIFGYNNTKNPMEEGTVIVRP